MRALQNMKQRSLLVTGWWDSWHFSGSIAAASRFCGAGKGSPMWLWWGESSSFSSWTGKTAWGKYEHVWERKGQWGRSALLDGQRLVLQGGHCRESNWDCLHCKGSSGSVGPSCHSGEAGLSGDKPDLWGRASNPITVGWITWWTTTVIMFVVYVLPL